ncbi:lipoprotein [Flavobacterium okayamense]|uniref:Type IV secretion system putative lipoprotein virB7 n=1 Tax=Flavobacterium okayamense TaxID=2830782 RepID=A0ABN6HTN9_9FLAO|nr:lipoprotein [Flavobacterium okayamense]BCY27888.1 hypothetical protein KK2020170_07560 [Flavobacterium okayamense]
MKKIFFLLSLLLVLTSCNLDDEPKNEYVLLPVEDVVMPTEFNINEVNPILIKYRRPTTCHLYNGLYYNAEDYTRTVAISFVKLNENNCLDASEEGPYEVYLNFKPTEITTYHFKFWLGVNSDGQDEFLEYDVEVN